MNSEIYMDNASTTKPDDRVVGKVAEVSRYCYGNASSVHEIGENAKNVLEESRKIIADSINADSESIVFTSGGTESNNLAVKGAAFAKKGGHIITAKTEHDCVLNACRWLEKQGFSVTYLDVDSNGFVSIKDIEKAIRKDTFLVSVMHANNEIGAIQDIRSIGRLCRKLGIYFHTDACQSYTKADINADDADLISLNAHKIHGPKGVGALYIRKGVKIEPLLHGGGQENNLRSGTENAADIAGFAEAVKISIPEHVKRMAEVRDYLIAEIKKVPGALLNGPEGSRRLCNNANFSFLNVEGESIAAMLALKGVYVSTGSACSSKSLEPSHVIMALEENPVRAHGSVRFSISRETSKDDADFAVKALREAVEKLRKISSLM